MLIRILLAATVVFFLLLWARAVVDVIRRGDLTGLAKVGWAVGMLVLPFAGLLLYSMLRPSPAQIARRTPPR